MKSRGWSKDDGRDKVIYPRIEHITGGTNEKMSHSVTRKQFIKSSHRRWQELPRRDIRRSTPEGTLYECNRRYETKYLRRPTLCVCRPIQTSFSPYLVCSASFGVSNWWLHRRAVPARALASFRSVCSQIERKSERIRVPVLAAVQPVLLKTSDYHAVTQFLSLGFPGPLRLLILRL